MSEAAAEAVVVQGALPLVGCHTMSGGLLAASHLSAQVRGSHALSWPGRVGTPERPTKLLMQRFIYVWTSVLWMYIGAAEPIGAAPKTDTCKSEKPCVEPIRAALNDPCLFPPTSNIVRGSPGGIPDPSLDSLDHILLYHNVIASVSGAAVLPHWPNRLVLAPSSTPYARRCAHPSSLGCYRHCPPSGARTPLCLSYSVPGPLACWGPATCASRHSGEAFLVA